MPHPILTTSLLLCLGTAALAQQSAGPLVGAATTFAVAGGHGTADAATLLHRTGVSSAFGVWPTTVPATRNLQHILAQHGAANLAVDDTSSGRDDIMVDGNGVVAVPPLGWGVFLLSFRNGAQGLPQSRLAAEPAADRGASVFSWVLPGSAVPAPLIDRVERSHGRSELGLAANRDVDALDVPTILGFDQANFSAIEPGFAALLPGAPTIYFTVANGSLALVPTLWWQQNGVPTPPSGATLLFTTMSASSGAWTPPRVWRTFAEIGLLQTDDIDALAYNTTADTMVFSCVGNSYDQLLFVDLNTDQAVPQPVKKPDQTPVSQAVGTAGGDDIDAVCTLDPRIRSGLYVADDFGASCGTPVDPYQPNLYPVGVNGSAFRRYQGGQRHYDSWLVGWPPQSGRGPGFALLVLTLGNQVAPALTAGLYLRNPQNPVAGDPIRFTQTIPNNFALLGLPLVFRWFAVDASGTEISQAYPIKAFL